MTIKIQSITDVITNSSSEIYTIIYKSDIDRIHDILEAILKTFDPDLDFDSAFTICPDYDEDDVNDMWNNYEEYEDKYRGQNLTMDQKAFIINEDRCDDGELYPVISGITIKANNPWNEQLANLFTKISNNQFESREIYT